MKYASRFLSIFIVFLLSLTTFQIAKADQRNYLSIWGGYLHIDAPEVEGYSLGNPFDSTFQVSPENAGFFGIAYGTPLNPNTFIFNHFEFYVEGQITETDSSRFDSTMGTNIIIPVVVGVSSFSVANAFVVSELDRERYEFGSKLALGNQILQLGGANLSLISFVGFGNENLDTLHQEIGGDNDFDRTTADLDWYFSGAMLGTDFKVPISTNVDFIIKGAAGIYYFDADADFRSTISIMGAVTQGNNKDKKDGFGFRGQLFAEVRSKLGAGMSLSLFGGVDYLSDVPYSSLPDTDPSLASPSRVTSIDTDDVVDLKVGAKITISLNGQ